MTLEQRAEHWIEPYWNAEHLRRTRDWLLELDPDASEALRLAALMHDIERHFPGGPTNDLSVAPEEDMDYRRAHSERSAGFVTAWLREQGIKALGTDAFTIDEPFPQMIRRYKEAGEASVIWPAHYASDALIHYEKLANLEQMPPLGALFVGPPMPLRGASAGPANPVGIVPAGLAAVGDL